MKNDWLDTVITKIEIAVFVPPSTGKHIHKNRANHGFVFNERNVIRNYHFDDGRVLRTEGNSLFYLPKGSSYHVEKISNGSCYAINFQADISDEPFSVGIRHPESLLHSFKVAADAWRLGSETRGIVAMRAVYDAIFRAHTELGRQYVSGEKRAIIEPAIQAIDNEFTKNDLSVSFLASLCGISEVYFRRLFLSVFSVQPKEYIIDKRIEYAKALLNSGDFSISEIATLCGYTEPCHFSREFTKRVGIPPSQYFYQS